MNSDQKNGTPSVLPFDTAEVARLGFRVNQATLARMMGVSRQTVSQWVKRGIVSTYPDGTIDPKRAYNEYLANADPSRMQHKVLKTFATELDELKAINEDLARQLYSLRLGMQVALQLLAEQGAWLDAFLDLIEQRRESLQACADADAWEVEVQLAFDDAGDKAMQADPAQELPRIDESLAAFWEPPEGISTLAAAEGDQGGGE